jgi:hypothetical protein
MRKSSPGGREEKEERRRGMQSEGSRGEIQESPEKE